MKLGMIPWKGIMERGNTIVEVNKSTTKDFN
jgi:hypothetical protein